MPRNVTSQNQGWLFWSHLFSVAVSIAAGVLIYWISGGFPPTTWQTLWIVLSQVQMLWHHGALSLVLQLIILGIQSLLLLFAWLVCLWIICIEAIAFVKYVFEPILLRSPLLSELVDNLYFAARLPLRIFSREQTDATDSGADSSFALSTPANLAPPSGMAGGLAQENTFNPFAPDHLRWFQQSPEPFSAKLQKIFTGKFSAVQVQDLAKAGAVKSNGNSRSLSEEEILQNPFEEPKEKSLRNPFELSEEETLQNPFELSEKETLQNPFEEPKEVSWRDPFERPKEVSWRNPFEEPEAESAQKPFERSLAESRDIADHETLIPTELLPTQNEEPDGNAEQSALADESPSEESTATLPEDVHTEDNTRISATSTETSMPTGSPGQSLLAGYCAQPEETAGETAHLELCATRTTLAGAQLLSGLYVIVSSVGETGSGDTISARVIGTMRERLEPLQNGTCSNEELKELFFVTGQHVYEQFLQKAHEQAGEQKKSYTLTGVLVLQEPDVNVVRYTAHVVHCGSSQLYCYSASKGLARITNDDEVETLLTQQSLTGEEGQLSAGQGWLMGASTMTKISSFSQPLQPRDRLLLCGSGLWNALFDRELTAFLALPVRNPMQIATLLQQAAIEANHKKQVMAMVVFIPE
jgi:serine/threonine protein phosphatase PrpC